jgi:hypothetical protein
MANPWEEFSVPTPQGAPQGAPRGAPPQAAPAMPAPDQASSGSAEPWGEFGGAGEDPAPPAFMGFEPAQDRATLLRNLRALTGKSAPADMIREYVRASGGEIPPETEAWLNDVYSSKPYETDFTAQDRPEVGAGEAAWEGLKSGALMGFGDEVQAAGGGLGSMLGGRGFSDGYESALRQARQVKEAAFADSPVAYGAGFLPGALTSAFVTRGRSPMPANASFWQRLGLGAREGAREGAISGVGNADSASLWDRAAGAGGGALLGGVAGGLSVPLTDLISTVAGRTYRALRPDAGPNSGLDYLAAAAPQDAAAMREGTGRLVDRVDESGRGVIRDAAGKMTPAREEVARHADQVYSGAQDPRR